jgi:hypothetical protein
MASVVENPNWSSRAESKKIRKWQKNDRPKGNDEWAPVTSPLVLVLESHGDSLVFIKLSLLFPSWPCGF